MFLELNKSKSTTQQNLRDTFKPALRAKLIAPLVYINKSEWTQIDDLMMQPKIWKNKNTPKSNPVDCKKQ